MTPNVNIYYNPYEKSYYDVISNNYNKMVSNHGVTKKEQKLRKISLGEEVVVFKLDLEDVKEVAGQISSGNSFFMFSASLA